MVPASCMSVERTPPCLTIEESCKLLNITCCMLSYQHSKLLLVSVYRSPSTAVVGCLSELRDLFAQLLSLTQYVYVVVVVGF